MSHNELLVLFAATLCAGVRAQDAPAFAPAFAHAQTAAQRGY
jgi:hypothetical protein